MIETMEASKSSSFEIKKRAEWWLDVSKLTLGTVGFPVVFTNLDWYAKVGIFLFGLIVAFKLSKTGFEIARTVKE